MTMIPSLDPRIEQAIEQIIRRADDVLGDCGMEELKPELRQILSSLVKECQREAFVAGWDAQRRNQGESTNPLIDALEHYRQRQQEIP